MNKVLRLLFVAAAMIILSGIASCHTAKPRGCGCGMEEHLR